MQINLLRKSAASAAVSSSSGMKVSSDITVIDFIVQEDLDAGYWIEVLNHVFIWLKV